MRSRFYSWFLDKEFQNAYIADAAAGEQITHQKILSNKEATTPRVKQIKYVWEGLPRIQNISIFSSYGYVLVHKTYISFPLFSL